MTFVTTSLAVAGLIAVAIPIAIHLLSRQRRRPVQWAAMRFLIEAFRKQRRRLRVQQLLLLTVRCLIVLLLGAALARPLLQQTGMLDTGGNRSVYLVIDNGMASSVMTNSNAALDSHRAQAVDIVEGLAPGDRVGIITAARPTRQLLLPPSSDHTAVVRLLEDIEPTDSPTDIAGALAHLHDALERDDAESSQQLAYVLSEFRNGSAPLDAPLPNTLQALDTNVTLLASPPATQAAANVQITAIDPVRNIIIPGAADGSGQITVRLQRSGGALDADVTRVRLDAAGLAAPEPRVVQWQPGQAEASVEFLLDLTGAASRQVTLTVQIDNDALEADNTRHVVMEMRDRIRVVMLQRQSFGFEARLDRLNAGQWIRRALEPAGAGPLEFSEIEPAALGASDLRAADVVIAARPDLLGGDGWSHLRRFVDSGGLLIVSPPGQQNIHQWTDRFIDSLDLPWQIDLEVTDHEPGLFLADEQPRSQLLRLVSSDLNDLVRPVVTQRTLAVDMAQTQAEVLLQFENNTPMAIAGSVEPDDDEESTLSRGMVVLLTVAPELTWTNLPSKPLMVPLMHEVVRQGLSSIRAQQRIVAGEQPPVIGAPAAANLLSPAGNRIALTNSRPVRALTQAGMYTLLDGADEPLGDLAVNVDASAGETQSQTDAAVLEWLNRAGTWQMFDADDPGALLRQPENRSPLAGVLLLIVLALIVLETLLARWFSHSYEGDVTTGAAGLQPTIGSHSSARGEPA